MNLFFQRLVLLRTWLKALFFSSNVEYDRCISYGPFTIGIFHVSIIFYPPVILSVLDSATGSWRENKKLKRPWTFSWAPILRNSKHKLTYSWYVIINWMEGHLKPFPPYQPPKTISSILFNLLVLELRAWGSSEWVRGCPTPERSRENPNCGQKDITGFLVFSKIFIVEATSSFYLVDIWCHDEINNSQSLGSTFPLRTLCRAEQKCWRKPEGSWQGRMLYASASVPNPQ